MVVCLAAVIALVLAPFAAAQLSSGWKNARRIDGGGGDAGPPRVVIDEMGTATVVWHQFEGGVSRIYANRYMSDSGWGTAQAIDGGPAGDSLDPEAAADLDGNVVVAWRQVDDLSQRIRSSRFNATSGWQAPASISVDRSEPVGSPQLALDRDGNALAVWHQSDGLRSSIWSNRFDIISGWGSPVPLETDALGDHEAPRIAVNGSGDAWAIWERRAGLQSDLWVNRFVPAVGWRGASQLESGAHSPDIAVDPRGNFVAVWSSLCCPPVALFPDNILASKTVGLLWGPSSLLENSTGFAALPQVGIDSQGAALAVWQQGIGGRVGVWTSRSEASGNWSDPSELSTPPQGNAFAPRLASYSNGSAVVVWSQSDGIRNVTYSGHLFPTLGWTNPRRIVADAGGDVRDPDVAAGRDGSAVAVWRESGSPFGIWANIYSGPEGVGPFPGWCEATALLIGVVIFAVWLVVRGKGRGKSLQDP